MSRQICSWRVSAGMIPNEEDPKFTRGFIIASDEWERTENKELLFLSRSHEVRAYATQLELHSASGMEPNWVSVEYVWM